mgnify:CR=1 FL=1
MHKITSFIIAETSKAKKGKEAPPAPLIKSAPHYFEKSVPAQFILGEEKVKINGATVTLIVKIYHPDAVLVVGNLEVADVFADGILELKDYKILGDGNIGSKIKVLAGAFSKSAKEKIEKAGGEVILAKLATQKEGKSV